MAVLFKIKKVINDIEVTFRTTSTSESITLPTNGTNDYVVNWADGSALQTVNTSTPPVHTYAVAGDYDVKINGSLNKWNFREVNASRNKIIKVDRFNAYKVGMTSLYAAFNLCTNLISAKGFNTSGVTNMKRMFLTCFGIPTLDLSNFDTSKVTDMGHMFYNCNLTSLNLSNWDTSKVTNMEYMFTNCTIMQALNLSSFDTSNVISMYAMFTGCEVLTTLDLSNFNTANVKNMSSMFNGCDNITSLDLSNWDTSSVTNMILMFEGCASLTSLDLSNFDTSNVTDMVLMFRHCGNNLCITADNNFTTTHLPDRYDMFKMFDGSNILHPTLTEQADLTDANGATYIYTGC